MLPRLAAWTAERSGDGRVDRDAGRTAARRALLCEGDARVDRPALVVELVPEVGMAAGRLSQLPGEWFGSRCPRRGCPALRTRATTSDVAIDGRQLVVIARDAHRHAWERDAIDALTARAADAIVIEIGLPHWRPERAATYVATYGAARVNVEAAAEALYSGPRRGVEQSGSSPGS